MEALAATGPSVCSLHQAAAQDRRSKHGRRSQQWRITRRNDDAFRPSCATSGTAAVATSALPVPLQAKRLWLAPCADALSAPRAASPRPSLSAEALAGRTRVRAEAQAGAGAAEVPPPETKLYDYVVIGSGIAGLRFALGVAAKGTVAVVTKAEPQEGSTNYAQGGVSAVLDPLDSIENHISDTIVAGAYLNDVEVVEVVCREGPERVRELMRMGASFDRGDDGRLLLAREGGHSHSRIVHAADVTGREIQRALLTAAQKTKRIDMFEHHMAIDLLTRQEDGRQSRCYGVEALDTETGQIIRFIAGSTLLATGGAGHVYPNTTNPTVATGDGVALALRAGAVISNMEFIQFHPTALADAGLPIQPPGPRPNSFLISEAVRGAGGLLYNQAGERFMLHYDPRAELAPRDVVARSIDDQLKRRGDLFVYLDISHKPTDEILRHFPNIAAECKRWGVDITKDPIPVVPAAHYMCGGVQTGLFGETSIRGLWAAGEVACTGLHGANRLASNSLLEALVFAQRAVEPAIEHAVAAAPLNHVLAGLPDGRDMDGAMWKGEEWEGEVEGEGEEVKVVGLSKGDSGAVAAAGVTAKYREQLKAIMWRYVGIVRSTDRLRIAQREIDMLASSWRADLETNVLLPRGAVSMETCEMENLINVASLVFKQWLQPPNLVHLACAATAELIGTMFFVFVGVGSVTVSSEFVQGLDVTRILSIGIAHGLALVVAVGAASGISGGHINPAVTLGMLAVGLVDVITAAAYVAAQLIGAVFGAGLVKAITPASTHDALGAHVLGAGVSVGQGVLTEIILTAILVYAVFATAVDPKGPSHLAPMLIGFAVLVDHIVGVPLTGASMNPARSFGAAVWSNVWENHWIYWVGSIIGACVVSVAYCLVFLVPREYGDKVKALSPRASNARQDETNVSITVS
ncbi:unnamed protein product [Closterium sp. Naga37s-1]|nr:unnamed protein product [Closterium sp. Naga37s-1]